MTKSDMNRQLAEEKILPLLVKLTIPATVAQLVNALYSIVDRMYIGHMPEIGAIALSGVGLTFPITILTSFFAAAPQAAVPSTNKMLLKRLIKNS